ncbi:hypothetical protein PVK06_016334 [Gossypium arboreum]|uniref:DUF4283 domain-containing protein n=1 Tax=Gossypium arboreum TaxID=29729 RepID=A0ABR0Q0H6_GOSAR|nr:hypothetical protein PVK06_016334 [Gossypium arboreum]
MPFHLMDIENEYFLAKLQSPDGYAKVLLQRPWMIYGQYLTIQPWTKDFTPSQAYPSMVLAWIRLPGLLGFLYKTRILEEIGGIIGKVVRLDFNTDSRTRGRFAWMAVYINLDKPLIAQVLVNGLHQKVEYEALPTICFTCGKYGHTKELWKEADRGNKKNFGPENSKVCKPAVDGAIGPYIAAIAEANGALGPDDAKSNMATSCDGQSQVNGVMDRPSTKSGSQVDVPEGFPKPLSGPENNDGDVSDIQTKADSMVPELVEIQVTDSIGGLNPQRHSAVLSNKNKSVGGDQLRKKNTPNSGGCASSKFLRAFREYNLEHKPDIVCLLELRVSGFWIHRASFYLAKRSVYGFLGTHKRYLMKSFGNIQKAMDWSSSSRLVDLEIGVRDELENVLNHEELL